MPCSRAKTLDPGLGQDGHKGGPGRNWTRTCWASYATVAPASILGLLGGFFLAAARPGQRPFSPLAQTWHSKIEIRDEYRK